MGIHPHDTDLEHLADNTSQLYEDIMLDKGAGKAVRAHAQAERYVSKALRALRQIGKLSRYQFSEPEIRQIFNAIHTEINEVETKFAPKPQATAAQPEFKFE